MSEGQSEDKDQPVQWSGRDYAQHSGHHRTADDWFLNRHPPAETDVVVDLGCGSGEFTARLAALVPKGRVIGIDQDQSMLQAARRHVGSNLEFLQSPAELLDELVKESSVDLIVSRAMLHWLPFKLYPRLLHGVFRVLRPGGWFHAEGAGPGNVPRLDLLLNDLAAKHGLPPTPDFPNTGLVLEAVEEAGFEIPAEGVRTVAQRRIFTREQAEAMLRTQGTLILTKHAPVEMVNTLVKEALDAVDTLRRHDGSYDQTFVRLEILARKPAA